MNKTDFLTVKEYAQRTCVTMKSVRKAIKLGRIPKWAVIRVTDGGRTYILINKFEADKGWVKYASLLHGTPAARAAVQRIIMEYETA